METVTKTVTKKLYEGMFLVDSALATADWDGVLATIRTILERAGAEISSLKKWDERKLAYDIRRKSRGTYILSCFKAQGQKLTEIERDVRLSEKIMRVLILSAEDIPPAALEKETPAMKAEREGLKAPEESTAVEAKAEEKPKETQSSEGKEMVESTGE